MVKVKDKDWRDEVVPEKRNESDVMHVVFDVLPCRLEIGIEVCINTGNDLFVVGDGTFLT